MNRKLITAFGIVLCFVIVFAVRQFAPADEPSKTATENAAMIGKGTLLLNIKKDAGLASSNESDFVTNARLVKIGDRFFVRGIGFVAKEYRDDTKYNWYQGVEVSYSLDSITQILDLTPEQVDGYMAQFKKE